MFRKYVYLHPSVGENKDGMDYEMMTNGAVPVKHQYINVDRRGKRDQQSPKPHNIPLAFMSEYSYLDSYQGRLTVRGNWPLPHLISNSSRQSSGPAILK